MQVQSIANTKSDINFKSVSATDKATAFVNMDESQLRLISYVSGKDKNQEKKNRNSLLKTFYAMPIIDTIASAILVDKSSKLTNEAVATLRKTKLSSRLAHAAGTAGFWAVSLAAIELYSIAKKSIQSNSPNMKKFDRQNPATSFLADITAICAMGVLGLVGLVKLDKHMSAKHPERAAEADRNIRKAKLLINRSKFNQETLPRLAEKMTKFAEANPYLAKTGRLALANSVLILFGVSVLKMIGQAKNERNRVETNYRNLKHTQLNVAKRLVNNLNEEKKVLTEELKATVEEKTQAEEVKKNCCEECEDVQDNDKIVREIEPDKDETTETESVDE